MAQVDWRLEGEWIKNCSCAYGCPCDFNANPTQGYCKGLLGMRIAKGHFGETPLDGLSFFVTVHFPGPLHEGNGQAQPIIDERATQAQRDALFGIMSGQNSAEGTLFQIFSVIVTKMHDPVFAPVKLDFDQEARKARLSIPGVLDPGTLGADKTFAAATGEPSTSPSVFYWNVIAPSNSYIKRADISIGRYIFLVRHFLTRVFDKALAIRSYRIPAFFYGRSLSPCTFPIQIQ